MNINTLTLSKNIEDQLKQFKQEKNYRAIAELITYAFQVNSKQHNIKTFGYLPTLFRTIEISSDENYIQSENIFIGEPVIYKIHYSGGRQLYGFNYFYIFCYFKEKSDRLNIYFQSANAKYKKLEHKDYVLDKENISFEGCISAFGNNNLSIISVSDTGHFIANLPSSFYIGSAEINFPQVIAKFLEKTISLSGIKLSNTLIFGSSAGSFGALLTSTYLREKTNVLAVNSQIHIKNYKIVIQSCFKNKDLHEVKKYFSSQISCFDRFKQKLNSIPNIYLLVNINDPFYQRNFNFFQNYIEQFTHKNVNNQSVFDSYYGVDGHGRPESNSLKAKIKIAREILTMKSTT